MSDGTVDQLRATIADLEKRLAEAQHQRDRALEEGALARAEMAKAVSHLQEIRGTLSWRITEPIRRVRAWSPR